MNQETSEKSILSPYRVLDLTDEKGWLCGKILGDLGADVIKIERLGGDPGRNIGPFYHDISDPEKSLYWFAYNTSKRGITLNLETQDGKGIFRRLVGDADFVLESFPPGYLDEMGLGYTILSEFNPRIIVSSITPFGQTGPYKDYKAPDIVAEAMGGVMAMWGDPDRAPIRCSVDQAQLQAGAQAALGTLIAHYHRELTGEGQHIDISMHECTSVTATWPLAAVWDVNRIIFRRMGGLTFRPQHKRRFVYPCKDGYVSWGIITGLLGPRTRSIVDWMDSEDMAGDLKEVDWGITLEDVTQEQIDRWEKIFAKFFLNHNMLELHEEAVRRDVDLYPVATAQALRESRQLEVRDFWVEVEHPELKSTLIYPGAPFKCSETSWRLKSRAPLIGEHNQEIYMKELGFTTEELVTLKQNNVI